MKIRCLLFVAFSLCVLHPALKAQEASGPVYPIAARAAGIEGTVTVKCTITSEGTAQNVRAVSGPQELKQAAVDWIKKQPFKWRQEVDRGQDPEISIKVNFSMGKTPAEKAKSQADAKAELQKTALP